MPFDTSETDRLLSTTRSVRRRLDLERPVPEQLILDCIDLAEQAPTGGNQPSRRWLVIRDPKVRQQVTDLYREAGGTWLSERASALAGSGDPRERAARSGGHLADHLHEVPVLVRSRSTAPTTAADARACSTRSSRPPGASALPPGHGASGPPGPPSTSPPPTRSPTCSTSPMTSPRSCCCPSPSPSATTSPP